MIPVSAVPLRGEGDLGLLRAPVVGRLQVLAAILHPLHRTLQLQRQGRQDHLLRVGGDLDAEAAADRRDHADVQRGHPQAAGDLLADGVRVLGGGLDDQPAAEGIGLGQHRAGLHRDSGHALIIHRARHDHIGLGERPVRVALDLVPDERDVVLHGVVELRRTRLDRRCHVHDDRQRRVVHHDALKGVARDVAIGRHDHRDRLPDVADDLRLDRIGHDRDHPLRPAAPLAAAVRHRPGELLELRAGVDGEHAGQRLRHARVDAVDRRVAVDAPQDRHMAEILRLHIVHVGRTAGDQAGVFLAPDARLHHPHVYHAVCPPRRLATDRPPQPWFATRAQLLYGGRPNVSYRTARFSAPWLDSAGADARRTGERSGRTIPRADRDGPVHATTVARRGPLARRAPSS